MNVIRSATMTLVLLATVGSAQEEPPAGARKGEEDHVLARVGKIPITTNDVQRLAQQTLRRWLTASEVDQRLMRFFARELVTRELARQALQKSKWGATWEEAMLECRRRQEMLEKSGQALSDYLKEIGVDKEAWEREVHWRLAWKRYLKHFATEENLKRFFDQRRRHFDGTRRHVAHILLRPASQAKKDIEEARREAKRLREQIERGEWTFEEAARRFSQSPSGKQGGDIGWIERRQPMPESFSRAAFDLPVGQISQPVTTRFGIHLIRVLEEKPGSLTWQDVREDLEKAIRSYLLEWLAERQRKEVKVEWLDAAVKEDGQVHGR